MSKAILCYNMVLPILCYIIGVICGRRSVIYKEDIASEFESIVEDDELTHVEYTHEQMGYEK